MMLFIFFLTLDIILLAAILLLLLYIKKIKREDRNAKSSEVINEYPPAQRDCLMRFILKHRSTAIQQRGN
jgi:hypothetical protein